MQYEMWLASAAEITPTAARDYLKAKNWIKVEGINGRLWVFGRAEQENQLFQIPIPMDQEKGSFGAAMLDAINLISDFEKRPVEQVISDLLLTPSSDVLKFRVVDHSTVSGTIGLLEATELLEGAKRSILAAACSVLQRVTHHPRMSLKPAENLLKASRMAQTEHQSFGVQVVCPLDSADEDGQFDVIPTYTRETTGLLMNACGKLLEGIEKDSLDDVLEANKHEPIITSNLCEALIRMQSERTKGTLVIGATWASRPSLPPPTEVPSKVAFKPEYFPIINDVHKSLRPAKTGAHDDEFVGTVETLNGDVQDDNRRAGEVIVSILLEEEVIKARLQLNSDQYEVAYNAHHDGLAYVLMRGKLIRGIRIARFERLESFKRLPVHE